MGKVNTWNRLTEKGPGQWRVLVVMSEELQTAMALMQHNPEDSKAILGASWTGKAMEKLFPEFPFLWLCFLLFAGTVFLLYLAI